MEKEKMSIEGQQLEENQQLLPLQQLVEAENPHREILKCPRCESENTKFMYYNNYSTSQPRHYCRDCKRSWTKGGTLRNVPFGGTQRRKRYRTSLSSSGVTSDTLFNAPPPPLPALVEVPIQPVYTFSSLPTRSIFGDGRLMTPPTLSFNQPPPLNMAGGYNNIGLPNPFIRTPQAQTGTVQPMGPAYQTLSAASHQQTHRLRSSGIGPFFNDTSVNNHTFITNPNSVWSNNNNSNGALGSFTDPNQISGFYGRRA